MPSRNASSCVSAVESQPLLSASECSRSVSGPASGSTGQALSSGSSFNAQLASLIWIRVVDPITFTQAFPYANELVAGIHVTDDPSWIGFYSGLLVSFIAFTHMKRGCQLHIIVGQRFRHRSVVLYLSLCQNIWCVNQHR
jgi:hypothetical protein